MSSPDFKSLRSGRPDCPSDFTLDRLHAGELSREQSLETERHVAGCAECGARMAERRAGFDGIDGVDPRAMLGRIRTGLDRPPSLFARLSGGLSRWMVPIGVVATTAVAIMVVTHDLRGAGPGVESETRLKGALALHVFRLAGDHAEEVVSEGAFRPGDRLRFTVDMPAEGHVKVLGVEASGALYTAWPLDPSANTLLATGTGIELPGAVSLDAQPGRETLHLVHCPVKVGPPLCTSGGPGAAPVCPAGCTRTAFIMDKGPRP